ncbi:MAG TPA: methyltransferase regulatory domain-containing protein [Buttiauxella sp.]|jgi:predicted O-linked N-acetylglucosamine transferase (SPINDLY family)/SAM-dependent methyltransferase
MYHFSCADISRASILEIGCRSGDNLLRHAAIYPESTSVGVDIDADRIATGVKRAEEQQLSNIHLYCMGLGDLLSIDVGKFDFIILPSLYALLDGASREALLDWCERQLSDSGVIALRWNTQPGARANKILQQAIGFHARHAQTEQAWLSSAKAMLSFMEMADLEGSLKEQVAETLHLTDAELLAQYLEESNDASLLTEFAAGIEASRLRMLGEVAPQYEMPRHYGEKIESLTLAVSTGKDRIQIQQYLDFAVQRSERFSLLISQQNKRSLSDSPDLERLEDMHWAASYALTDDENQRITRFSDKVDTSNPEIRRVLDWLAAAWPRSLSTEQIIHHTLEPEKPEDHREIILRALRELYVNKPPLLYVSISPSPYNTDRRKRLELNCTFSDSEAAGGAFCARTNWWGERLAFKREEFALYEKGLKIDGEQEAKTAIELAGKGLISGSALSWARLWQGIYRHGGNALLEGCLRTYLLAISPVERGGMLSESEGRSIVSAKPKETVNVKKARQAEVLLSSGQVALAKEKVLELMDDNPEDMRFLILAADTFKKSGEYDLALNIMGKRLSLDGDYLTKLEQLGYILAQRDEGSATAKLIFQYLIKNNDRLSIYWQTLSAFYNAKRQPIVEEYCLSTAIDLNETNAVGMLRLATLLSHIGRLEEAKALCNKTLALPIKGKDRSAAQAMYLFILSHDSAMPAQEKFLQHVEFGRQAKAWASSVGRTWQTAERDPASAKIRIGFVSGDLNDHPVHLFVYPVWRALSRDKYELCVYATGKQDPVADLYKDSATLYRNVIGLSEHELAGQIAADGVDVLIDLSGYTNGHRLLTFALKPAPVQMSWIGFVGTTGLQEMDYYVMADGLAAPGELDSVFTEKLVSLPSAKLFEYSPLAPAVNELPALKNGYLTLGNFNRPQKLTAAILDCWAKILIALPNARLLFGFMADDQMIAHYREQMTQRGVSPEQLDFRNRCSFVDYLAMHNEVDILLDSHPYSAGTTAQHASWMGVPVVTAYEGSAVSRTSTSTMRTFNLHEFVTSSLEEYAQKVIELNGRYEYLNTLRLTMRERILRREKSHSHNAYYFEKMIDAVWQRHLNGEAPEPLFIEDEHRWENIHAV